MQSDALKNDPAWTEFRKSHLLAQEARIARMILTFLILGNPIVSAVMLLLARDPLPPLISNICQFSAAVVLLLLFRRQTISGQQLANSTTLILLATIIFNAWYIDYFLDVTTSLVERTQIFIPLIVLTALQALIAPVNGRRWYAFGTIAFIAMVMGVMRADRWVISQSVVLGVSLGVALLRNFLSRFFENEIHLAFERIRSSQIEEASRQRTALELARKMQSSVMPDPEIQNGSVLVRTYQRTYEEVGGDWVGVRNSGDKTFVVVADATGKGFQAALVVHAIQALWASSMADRFNALSWLKHVNDALCFLGKRERHTATVGVLCIERDTVTYWSAGHPPVYWRTTSEGVGVHALAASGSIAGISETFTTPPVTMQLDPHETYEFIIGSDGVLDRKGIYKRANLGPFMDELKASGTTALDRIKIEDDRSIVLIVRSPYQKQITSA